ncbi:GNAT family N-acetyltransferase [Micromonospora sp. NPDC049799]|uniref:GNAT family N-acetyltransferase n=1 Tax=Micromonospora sp. NPDC049799 TaxID=3154741 RepID=UPI0033E79400
MIIRPYQPDDRDAVHDICIRTADAGEDASTSYADPDILPEIFAHPYSHLEPDLAFVLDHDGVPVGYVLGTADTAAFARRFRSEWLPLVSDRYPPPNGDPTTPDAVMAHLLHTPERMVLPDLAHYPAHLHIDLLAGYRRSGHGRALVDRFVTALRERGTPAVHVGMVTANRRARPFYDRLGFRPLPVADPGPLTYLGLAVPDPPAERHLPPYSTPRPWPASWRSGGSAPSDPVNVHGSPHQRRLRAPRRCGRPRPGPSARTPPPHRPGWCDR